MHKIVKATSSRGAPIRYSGQSLTVAAGPPIKDGHQRLFHFTSEAHAINNIENHRIKVSLFSDLNDPFELLAASLKAKSDRKAAKRLRADVLKDTGLLCFSENWSEPVLWSHYADRHKGICLGFDLKKGIAEKVHYELKRIEVERSPEESEGKIPERLKDRLMRTKYQSWNYEQEHRVFVQLSQTVRDGGLYFRSFDADLQLAQVILGPECPAPLPAVRELVSKSYKGVEVFRARLAFKSFGVVADERTVKR